MMRSMIRRQSPLQLLLRARNTTTTTAAATAVHAFEEIPQPRKDAKSYDPPLDTHVELFMQLGGPFKFTNFLDELYKVGDVVQYRFPGAPASVVMFDPDEMMKVHKAAGPTPAGSTVTLWPFMEFYHKVQKKYKGVPMAFTTDPAYWKKLRHAMQRGVFGYEDAKSYVPLIAQPVRDAVGMLPNHGEDMINFLNRSTFELFHSVLFGIRSNVLDLAHAKEEDVKFVNSTMNALYHAGSLRFHPMAAIIPKLDQLPKEYADRVPKEVWDMWDQFCKSTEAIVDIGASKFEKLEKAKAENTFKAHAYVDPLVVRYLNDGLMNRDEVLLNVAGLLQGGVDTTANTILWSLTRLAQYPQIQPKLRAEIRAAKSDRKSLWTADQLDQLKLLSSFVEETMRLAPTANGHLRVVPGDCSVTSQRTGKSYKLPKGTLVHFSPRNIQNDPAFVQDPNEFKLDRFTRECKHARRGTPQAKIDNPVTDVFSFGPRMCLGGRLAKVELLNFLAEVIDTYDVNFAESSKGKEFTILSTMLTRPDPTPTFTFTKVE